MFKYALCALALLTGCGTLDYKNLPEDGKFDGSLLVMWVGENTTNSGSGRFVFVPTPGDPLRFVRAEGIKDATVREIKPGMMYTDGGSIPRQIQLFNGFSPWGYAPAYMVHDWLFVARHCILDGNAQDNETDIENMKFIESAQIIGEAIKALILAEKVQKNDVAPAAISSAVAGPISYQRWVATGECQSDRVSDVHRQQIEAALSPAPQTLILRGTGNLDGDPLPRLKPARLVSEIKF